MRRTSGKTVVVPGDWAVRTFGYRPVRNGPRLYRRKPGTGLTSGPRAFDAFLRTGAPKVATSY